MARFDVLAGGPSSTIAGTALITISVAFIVAATRIYVDTVRRLRRNEPFEGQTSHLVLALAGLLVALGAMTAAYLLT